VAVEERELALADGRRLPFDHLFWATGVGGPAWLAGSGLPLDERGLVRVAPTLAVLGQERVYAAGDMAVVEGQPRPRSGVYAVRQAEPLLANLRRALRGERPEPVRLQRRHLSIVSTGDGRAVAMRGRWAAAGAWAWRLKDRIDRAFMAKFAVTAEPAPDEPVRCLGCGAKVGAAVLAGALARVKADLSGVDQTQGGTVLLGLGARDDAAHLAIPAGRTLVQSVDYLPALVADPFVFGQIAAAHAFSDVFAMGATPHSAQALVNLPRAAPALMEEHLYQLVAGVTATLRAIGAVLLGGHTTEAPEAALGLVVNGLIGGETLFRKSGLAAGDALVLTKGLGTGALFAAAMRGLAEGRWLEAAVASMTQTNAAAAAILREHGAQACTDVTGFGLAGHLGEMAAASGAVLTIELERVPLLPGAAAVAALGVRSSLYAANRGLPGLALAGAPQARVEAELLFDPQTSGGLVAGVPAGRADACVAALAAAGCSAARIGRVEEVKGRPWINVC
jgi:selenide,water dikinase